MNSQVWVCSEDAAFARQVTCLVERELDVEPSVLSWKRLARMKLPEAIQHKLLLDLRSVDVGQVLENMRQKWPGPSDIWPQCVGIFEDGFPVANSSAADRILDASLPYSELESRLAAVLRKPAKETSPAGRGETRQIIRAGDCEFVTSCPAIISQLETLDLIAEHDLTILLIGETGTGKTTLARMIHLLSPRRDSAFMALSCASLTSELIASELFGHVKGAFTGAADDKTGRFEAVGRGTILLDEIDVLSPLQQANLLRVIETGEFEPVGSNDTRKTQARIVAAANVCLKALMEAGEFRSDLYYRLNQIRFDLPPLRERLEDLVPLAVHFVEECCQQERLRVDLISPGFLSAIKSYHWPGNIRELRNEVRRAVLFCRDRRLTESLLSQNVQGAAVSQAKSIGSDSSKRLEKDVAQAEAETIKSALKVHQFNRAATARSLGISRVTLYNKIRKYQIRID